MMRRLLLAASLILFLISGAFAQVSEKKGFSYGILYMAGGKYDNVRMCVATGNGVKGGPIADIMFLTRYNLTEKYSVTFNLPVMRPLLFGIAFQMLQFEPEFTFHYRKALGDSKAIITGPGLGVSLNYGPDYKSDLRHRGNAFFSAGPFISWQFGLEFKKTRAVGLRAFYVPLIAKDHPGGTVLGGALEYAMYF